MRKSRVKVMPVAAVVLLMSMGLATTTRAETGTVRVVFTKGGFIVGVGAGKGVLTFHGKHSPFTVSGMLTPQQSSMVGTMSVAWWH